MDEKVNAPGALRRVLQDNRKLQLVEENIYSVFSGAEQHSHYDKIAPLYDLVVGTNFYNRLMWGCSTAHYTEFARRALNSGQDGLFLDAGCGSMLFTARVFCESRRTIIAFDRSLEMLRRAKQRLLVISGVFPPNVVLLQADVFDLPFRLGSFQTVLSLAISHLFENTAVFVGNLRQSLDDGGGLYFTSLAKTGRFTDIYLSFLSGTGFGGIARPKTGEDMKEISRRVLGENTKFQIWGNFIFVTAEKR